MPSRLAGRSRNRSLSRATVSASRARGKRLQHVVDGALLEGGDGVLVVGGHEHDVALAARQPRDLEPGHAGHLDVEEQHVGRMLGERARRLDAVGGLGADRELGPQRRRAAARSSPRSTASSSAMIAVGCVHRGSPRWPGCVRPEPVATSALHDRHTRRATRSRTSPMPPGSLAKEAKAGPTTVTRRRSSLTAAETGLRGRIGNAADRSAAPAEASPSAACARLRRASTSGIGQRRPVSPERTRMMSSQVRTRSISTARVDDVGLDRRKRGAKVNDQVVQHARAEVVVALVKTLRVGKRFEQEARLDPRLQCDCSLASYAARAKRTCSSWRSRRTRGSPGRIEPVTRSRVPRETGHHAAEAARPTWPRPNWVGTLNSNCITDSRIANARSEQPTPTLAIATRGRHPSERAMLCCGRRSAGAATPARH